MRRWIAGGMLVVAGAVAMAPMAVRPVASRKGWEVEGARWCADGVCVRGISKGESRVERAVLRWDRTLVLDGLKVKKGSGSASTGTASAGWLRGIEVSGLELVGVPLPPLSGTLAPVVSLTGEGVAVEGDTVRYVSPWGEVEVRLGPPLQARCEACTFELPTLASRPLSLPPVRAEGEIVGERFVGSVAIGGLDATVDVGREGGTARFADQSVASLYEVLGTSVPAVDRARMRGTFSGSFPFRLPGPVPGAPEVSVEGLHVDGLVGAELAEGTFRHPVRDADGERAFRVCGEGSPDWLSLAAIGRVLPAAIVAAEDSQFHAHPGFDIPGMIAAADENAAAGEIVRGGSTLTQQLAKNLFLSGERTYARKLSELLYAVELERELGKDRILELYLNVVEWGPGIHGAKQAARTYFLKSPAGLLPEEAAFLASILRNPRTAWRTQYLRGRPGAQRVRWILDNMVGFDRAALEAAKDREIHFVPP